MRTLTELIVKKVRISRGEKKHVCVGYLACQMARFSAQAVMSLSRCLAIPRAYGAMTKGEQEQVGKRSRDLKVGIICGNKCPVHSEEPQPRNRGGKRNDVIWQPEDQDLSDKVFFVEDNHASLSKKWLKLERSVC